MNPKVIRVFAFLWLLTLPSLSTEGSVRLSFLTSKEALQDTVRVLRSGGCSAEAVAIFERAVERYYSAAFSFDSEKFPKPTNGFYQFVSAAELVTALQKPLADTDHPYELNCFDTVIALAGDSLRTSVSPDDVGEPYLVPYTTPEGSFAILPKSTAREAFGLVYPPWYRNVTQQILPDSIYEQRACLTASLFCCYKLPETTSEGGLADTVLKTLKASWTKQRMTVPKRFELVLGHEVNLPQHWFVTAHAGLLFPHDRGYTYIEKSGGGGPFVRLDFEDRATLPIWLSGTFKGAGKFGYTHHFATFGDTIIREIKLEEIMPLSRKLLLIFVAILVIVIAAFVASPPLAWRRVKAGMNRSEVYSRLGQPQISNESTKGGVRWRSSRVVGRWELDAFFRDDDTVGAFGRRWRWGS